MRSRRSGRSNYAFEVDGTINTIKGHKALGEAYQLGKAIL